MKDYIRTSGSLTATEFGVKIHFESVYLYSYKPIRIQVLCCCFLLLYLVVNAISVSPVVRFLYVYMKSIMDPDTLASPEAR